MMPYNPFERPIGDSLTAEDLQSLIAKEVTEGYFVEYKSSKPDNKKIGHSIASFGNTLGGWYVIGVEADKTQNVAKRICGFAAADWHDPIATVRDVVKTHISPPPVFFPQVVRLDETGDQLALVVYVPGEQDTPFVSQDGRIYTRVQDSSDPIAQRNRHELDQLISRGRDSKKRFARFCQDTRSFSKDDSGLGWLHVYIMPYPLGLVLKPEVFGEEGLERAITLCRTPLASKAGDAELFSSNMSLVGGMLSVDSVTLRGVMPSRVGRASLTAQFFAGGSAKFHIPVETIANPLFDHVEELNDPSADIQTPAVRATIRRLRSEAAADNYTSLDRIRFFHLGRLWFTLSNLLNLYEAWLGEDGYQIELKVALALSGVWRMCPFIDEEHWARHVDAFGLPVIHEDSVRDPWELGDGYLLPFGHERQLWLDLVPHATELAGLPQSLFAHGLGESLERERRLQAEKSKGK